MCASRVIFLFFPPLACLFGGQVDGLGSGKVVVVLVLPHVLADRLHEGGNRRQLRCLP